MVIRTLLLMALLFSISVPASTQISAAVDKNPALLNESITLDVILDARVDAAAIDFSGLKSDFTVMMPSVSQSTRIINGKTSQSTQWKVVLLAKKAGNFTIPRFSYQGLTTEPIALTILGAETAASAATNTTTKDLFLQSSIEQDQLYVQQLSYYKVQIFFNTELQRGALSEPSLEGAIIQQVGQDVEGSELVNGIRYRTISRRYAITPQQSGNFTISPPTFSGEMLDRDSQQYGYYSRTKKVVQQAQAIEIAVKPIPDSFPADWLIAGLVTLSEEWTPDVTQLTIGEPITRTITLSAVDVAENQLPELNLNFPRTLRLYQEQPQAKSAERNGHIIAQKIFTTAVIATSPGEVTLPEVKLPWWNSKTNQMMTAVLPAKTFQVNPAANASDNSMTTSIKGLAPATNDSKDVNKAPSASITLNQPINNWAWTYSTSALLALWITSLLIFYLLWQWRNPELKAETSTATAKFNSHALKMACKNNDPEATKQALLRWGHRHFNQQFISLNQLTPYLNSAALSAQIEQLNAALYANSSKATSEDNDVSSANKNEHWQGQTLWQQWQQYKPTVTAKKVDSDLAPLYPNDV